MDLLNYLFNFVMITSKLFNIDETHALKHSMDVYYFSNKIYESELANNTFLINHKKIIDTSAILHDMCDKKYIDEKEGIKEIKNFLQQEISDEDCETIITIISTMSYSTVKKNGFPLLYEKQMAYHIVREADLLASLDFDRCMAYKMLKLNGNIHDAFIDAEKLFNERMFKHNLDNLYITDYAKNKDLILQNNANLRINNWKKILKIN